MSRLEIAVLVVPLLFIAHIIASTGPYRWMRHDAWDEINDKVTKVTKENCARLSLNELRLSPDTVSQKPWYNKLLIDRWFDNRTNLIHIHNMALNRAFFFSYVYQKLNQSEEWLMQPNLHYIYFSVEADVAGNQGYVNGSGIFWDKNASYPNFYTTLLPFNKTMLFFGPRAWRSFDDYIEPTNWVREPTNGTFDIQDYGAGPDPDYTKTTYPNSPWYLLHFGQIQEQKQSVFPYEVCILYSNTTGKYTKEECTPMKFFGPYSPKVTDEEESRMPVRFTQPYFDCGRSNRWIVSAAAPIVDYVPRYLNWTHMRRGKIIATAVTDIEFFSIDYNPCPISEGNPYPNIFAQTDRCKNLTMCEPSSGHGFRRGGYVCHCRPGYRYPQWQEGPWPGEFIERAIKEERDDPIDFSCHPVGFKRMIKDIEMTGVIPDRSKFGILEIGKRKKRSADNANDIDGDDGSVSFKAALRSAVRQLDAARDKHKNSKGKIDRSKVDDELRRMVLKEVAKRHRAAAVAAANDTQRSNRRSRLYITDMAAGEPGMSNETAKSSTENVKVVNETDVNLPPILREKRNDKPSATNAPPSPKKTKFVASAEGEKLARQKRAPVAAWDPDSHKRMNDIFEKVRNVTQTNCMFKRPEDMEFPEEVGYGADKFFDPQSRMAVRLANFLSNVYQNVFANESLGAIRSNETINIELLFGEALAMVMGDVRIYSAGIWFDVDKYQGRESRREFFAPFAWRPDAAAGKTVSTSYKAKDMAGEKPKMQQYVYENWFQDIKMRWFGSKYGLKRYTTRMWVRESPQGNLLQKFERHPMFYWSANSTDGVWSRPHFDCQYIKDWTLRYAVPFFGLKDDRSDIEFKGVVTVNVLLSDMDITQCPQPYNIPNAFKNTAICDYQSTFCMHLQRSRFRAGGYKCECRQGYEYPFNDYAWYFDGQTMEEHYRRKMNGEINMFDQLKCRLARGAPSVQPPAIALVLLSSIFAAVRLLL